MEVRFNKGDIVIAPEGCESYLTPQKEYKVLCYVGTPGFGFSIIDDEGDIITCCINRCSHLFFKNWIIKSEQ